MYVKTSSCPPIHPHPPEGHYSAPPMYSCVWWVSSDQVTLARFKGLGRIYLYIINKKDIDLALYKSFLCIPAPLLADHFSAHVWFKKKITCVYCVFRIIDDNRCVYVIPWKVQACFSETSIYIIFTKLISTASVKWQSLLKKIIFYVKKIPTQVLYFIKGIAYKYIEFKSTQTFKKNHVRLLDWMYILVILKKSFQMSVGPLQHLLVLIFNNKTLQYWFWRWRNIMQPIFIQ